MSLLSRLSHVGHVALPRLLRPNLNGIAHVTSGIFAGHWVVSKRGTDEFFVVAPPDPATGELVVVAALGAIGRAANHRRADDRTPFDIPAGPAVSQRGLFWDEDRRMLMVSFQKTYGQWYRAFPSLYAIDLETTAGGGQPTVQGPWAFQVPHECTGGNILERIGDSYLVTGWDANTFQLGSHGADLSRIVAPTDRDPICDLTYDREAGGWVYEAEWERLPAQEILFTRGETGRKVYPGGGVHTMSVSHFTPPFGVDPATGEFVRGGSDRAWGVVMGKYPHRDPYHRGPYAVFLPSGEVYEQPGPAGGGRLISTEGWQTAAGHPQDASQFNVMPTMHWASAVVTVDGERHLLQPYDVLWGYRHYGMPGEFAYPNPKDGSPCNPITSAYHPPARNPAGARLAGCYYATGELGTTHRGYREEVKVKTFLSYNLSRGITSPTQRPDEWVLAHDWAGWLDARTAFGYLDPLNPDGTVKTARFNPSMDTTAVQVLGNRIYVHQTDCRRYGRGSATGGVLNVFEIV
jgi:hypothetical protein